MNEQDYLTAKAIIIRSLKSGTLLTEYKAWDNLDFDARRTALFDSRCGGCNKIKLLPGTIELTFGTEGACKDCMDQANSRLMAYKEEWRNP